MGKAGKGVVQRRMSRRFQTDMLLEGLLVGFVSGAVVMAYRMALGKAEGVLRFLLPFVQSNTLYILAFFVALLVLCLLVGKLVYWEPYTQGSGIPQVDAEVMGRVDMPWWRVVGAKFAEGTLCALGGLSLGREGPSVQLGAMAAKGVSRGLGRGRGEERLLITCGAAAGMSAAFNAPLTGVLFALEEIHKEFSAPLIVSVMAASVASSFLAGGVLGVQPVLSLDFATRLPNNAYYLVLLFGAFCGVLGALHNCGMFALSERLFDHITLHAPYGRFVLAFAITGIVALVAPNLLCGGDAIAEILKEPARVTTIGFLLLLLGKYAFTCLCFGSGAPGGTLFPLCILGMLSGGLFASACCSVGILEPRYLANFVVLGIGGLFASVVRSPVTAVVLAFELTGSFDALLSVSIVAMVSYVIANTLNVDPFYEHLLARLIGRAGKGSRSEMSQEKSLRTYVVGAGSMAEGKTIAQVEWPAHTRVLSVSRAGEDVIPTGQTQLIAFDELLIIMDAYDSDSAEERLWALTKEALATRSTPKGRAHLR